jgi:hypothetical protein
LTIDPAPNERDPPRRHWNAPRLLGRRDESARMRETRGGDERIREKRSDTNERTRRRVACAGPEATATETRRAALANGCQVGPSTDDAWDRDTVSNGVDEDPDIATTTGVADNG